MRVDGELSGTYPTTTDFVSTLSKYITITQICNKDNLTSCFEQQIKDHSRIDVYDFAQQKNANNIDAGFSADLVGIRLSNGTSAILAYNPDCYIEDMYDANADVTGCLVMIYDVNNQQKPNVLTQDIATINLYHDIYDEELQLEIGEVFSPTAISLQECYELIDKNIINDTKQCCDRSYYAGAIKECNENGMRLPTAKELSKIATQIYGQTVLPTQNASNLKIKDKPLAAQIGLTDYKNAGAMISIDLDPAYGNRPCYKRAFNKDSTTFGYEAANLNYYNAFCVK